MKIFKTLSLILALTFFVSGHVAAQFSDPSAGIPSTSSDYKIFEDYKIRAITNDQVWLYRVQARFNQLALPEKYRETPDDNEPRKNALNPQFLNEVIQALPKMSAATQQALIPYLMPPASSKPNTKNKSMQAGCPGYAPIPLPFPEGEWIYDDRDPTFRFWYVNYPRFGQDKNEWMISHLLPALNKSKAKYEALLGKQLLSDAGGKTFTDASGVEHTWCDGGNGKYDIYLNRFEDRYYGMTLAYPGVTSQAPTFIIIDPVRLYGLEELTEFTAAHELMHAFQFAHERNLPYQEYTNSDEGMANWAAHSVFPENNSEHGYTLLSHIPDFSLLKSDYDSWIFYLYAVHENDENFIPRMLQEEVSLNPFQALDKLLNGGLKKAFPEFSLKAWNKEEMIGPSLKTWDNFKEVPTNSASKELKLNERGEFMVETEYPLPMGLTRAYEHYVIDPKVKSISLSWGKAGVPEGNFHLRLMKKKNGSWISEDWDPKSRPEKYKFKETICFDDPQTERFDEIFFAFSRSDITPQYGYWDNSKIKLRIGANNVPCYAVEGTGKYSKSTKRGTPGKGDYYEEKYESNFTSRFEAKRDPDGRLTDRWELKTVSAKFNYTTTKEIYDPCGAKLLCMFNKSLFEKIETCTGTKSGTVNIDTKGSSFQVSSVYTNGSSPNMRYYSFNIKAGLPGVEMINVDCPKSPDYINNVQHIDFQSTGLGMPTMKPDGQIHGEWSQPNQGNYVWDFIPVK